MSEVKYVQVELGQGAARRVAWLEVNSRKPIKVGSSLTLQDDEGGGVWDVLAIFEQKISHRDVVWNDLYYDYQREHDFWCCLR